MHSGNPDAVGLCPVCMAIMTHSSEWQQAGPCSQAPLVHALKLCLCVKMPLLHPYLYQYLRSSCSWNMVQEHLGCPVFPWTTGFAGYMDRFESWSPLHLMHIPLVLCITAAEGKPGSLLARPPHPGLDWTLAKMAALFASLPATGLTTHRGAGLFSLILDWLWQTFCNNLFKGFLHALGSMGPAAPKTTGLFGCRLLCLDMVLCCKPMGKIECISSDLAICKNVPSTWKNFGEPRKCSIVRKSVEILWPGSLLALLNTVGKSIFEVLSCRYRCRYF